MIYEHFECILVQLNNWKQDPVASYTNKYQKHIDCSHGYKKVYGDYELVNILSHAFKKFINHMIKESK